MIRFYILKIIAIVTICMFVSGCTGNTEYLSVSSLAHRWLEIKILLTAHSAGQRPVSEALDDFTAALDSFFVSPAGKLYQTHRPAITIPVTAMSKTVERLREAVRAGDENGVRSIMLEIDTTVDQLQIIDTGLSDTIQLRYFQLFFFFSLLVILTVLALWLLNRRLEKAIHMERQSHIFSRETVIAQEQERSRIARELHDTIAQDLWRLSFRTDSISRTEQAEERRLICEEVVSGQQELMQRIRTICDTLVPPDFRRRGLPDAIRSLCYDFSQRTGIECAVTVQKGLHLEPLDADMQLQCFRIVQECIANIEKHAGASEVSVLISNTVNSRGANSPDSQLLRINVSDNGRGFGAPNSDTRIRLRAQSHFGLWNMYERAESLRGTLVIDSETGGGARVTLELPLKTEAQS